MKQKIIQTLSFILTALLFTQTVFADDANIDGGGGGMGQGNNSNGWVITSQNGTNLFDAEGLRVYLVNSSTGVPVSASVDITNSNVRIENVYNGRGKTKYEYKHIDSSLSNFNTSYQKVLVDTSPQKLPNIIPWNESGNTYRIDAIKNWFLDKNYADWVLSQLGTNIENVRGDGYLLACNVRNAGGTRVNGYTITSRNPASAEIVINNKTYNISNIYIPSGSEQLVWVKWKTPSTPQNVTAFVSCSRGYLYNIKNSGSTNRYVTAISATINIFDNDMENPPPDPTLNDTASSIGYNLTTSSSKKHTLLSSSTPSNSWYVWNCYTVQGYYVFYKINYTAEVRSSVKIKPDINCPTAYAKNNTTYMKSGYGINAVVEPFIRLTTYNERTGSTTTNNYYLVNSTSNVCTPQYVFAYFPEFNFAKFNRQLDNVSNSYNFRKNKYSTYFECVHYTPWWFPDNQRYSIVTRNDFAYTPAGKLSIYAESDGIMIEQNLMDDWHIAATR